MSDLVERLLNRLVNCENYGKSVWMTDRKTTLYEDIADAAARIKQLEAENAQLREALKEFVHPHQSGRLTERERDEKARAALKGKAVSHD